MNLFWKRVFLALVIIFALVLLVPGLLNIIILKLIIWQTGNSIPDNIPINSWLRSAFGAFLGVLAYYGYRKVFSFNEDIRNKGIFAICIGVCTFPIIMWFLTKDALPFKRCASDLKGGWVYIDEGIDIHPKFGTKACDCTSEMIRMIENMEYSDIKKIEVTINTRFFGQENEPLIWYYEHEDGKLEFFSQSGFHPQLGEKLLPVNRQIVKRVLEFIKSNQGYMIMNNIHSDSKILSIVNNSEKINPITKEVKPFKKNYSSYINSAFSNNKDLTEVSVTIFDENNNISESLSSEIANIYNLHGNKGEIGFLKNQFVQTPEFLELTDGGSDIISKMDLSRFTDYLAIGNLKFSYVKGSLVEGTIVCIANMSINIISTNQKALVKSFEIKNVKGNGVSREQAQEIAMQRLLNKFSENYAEL